MIGVRLLSRGRGAFRTDCARWIVLAAVLAAAAPSIHDQSARAGAKSEPNSADPFLEEDTSPPADEIPPVPESGPKGGPEKPNPVDVPKLETPRLPREIKQTAPPRQESAAELDAELPPLPSGKAQLPPRKQQPLEGSSGWKSSLRRPQGKRGNGPASPDDPESTRFEPEADVLQPDKPLAAIFVEGNKTIQTDEIRKLIKSRPGRPADPKLIKEDVRTLTSKRWFMTVEVRYAQSPNGPALVFKVTERPMLQKITYLGYKKIKEKELAEVTGLKVGDGYDVGRNRESAQKIENLYREKGYLHARVEIEKGDSLKDREVVFRINEGPKVVVAKISFSGNKFVRSDVLKTQVKTKTQILWLFGGKYDPITIPDDKVALKTYYHNLGFFDVKVTSKEGISDDKAKVHIEYQIEEGVRYKVRNVEFVGNRVIPVEKLRENLKMRPNEFYNERFVTADKEKMLGQYGELGRIWAEVKPVPRFGEEAGPVDLIYEIKEDKPYRIGRINVRINGVHPHTRESVVLTKLLFKPGDLANKSLIDKSEQRLKNTQVFAGGMPGQGMQQSGNNDPPPIALTPSEIQPARRQPNIARGQDGGGTFNRRQTNPTSNAGRTNPGRDAPGSPEDQVDSETLIFRGQNVPGDIPPEDTLFDDTPVEPLPPDLQPPGYIDANVNVSETQTGRINFGVGLNSTMGFVGNATLEENNFDILRPPRSIQDIIDGTAFRGAGQQFRIEAVPGLQSSLSGSFPVSRYVVSWRDPYFLEQNVSLGVSGSYYSRFQPDWIETRTGGRVTVGRQFSPYWSGNLAFSAEDVRITNPSVPTPEVISAVLGDNFLSTVTATVAHDTRDSPFLPGRGHYIDVNYQQGIANFVFPKVFADFKQYFLVHERPDGGSRQIISLTGTVGWTGDQTPFFERFFAGGMQNFRGFQYYGVTPRVNGVRVGGNFEFLGSAEYLVPLTADNMFQIAAFTDFGTVDSTVTLDAFRITVGGGFRVSVPMMGPVPLAVDFAVPLRRQPFDTTQVISFGFYLLR